MLRHDRIWILGRVYAGEQADGVAHGDMQRLGTAKGIGARLIGAQPLKGGQPYLDSRNAERAASKSDFTPSGSIVAASLCDVSVDGNAALRRE